MAKDKITEYDSNASLNTDVGGVNLAENSMNPSDVNNAIREVLSHQKEAFGSGTPLYVDQTNNRVGVGTASPSIELDVVGSGTFTGDLTVDTDTLFADASNDKVGINNASPNHELQINGNSTTSSLSLKTSATGNTTSDGLELKVQGDSSAYLYNYENAMLRFGTNGLERMRIDANGHVTMPSQCGFLVHRNSNLNNIGINTALTQSFATEVFDTNSDFSGTTFTAPVDGFYFLHASARLADVDTGASYYFIQIATSNRTNTHIMRPAFSSDGDYHQLRVLVYQQMDAGDTAVVNIQQQGGTSGQTDVLSSSAYTFFNGYLVN